MTRRASYRLHLRCPRCGKLSETVSDQKVAVVNCGDCLMDDVEIVEFKVTKVEVLS